MQCNATLHYIQVLARSPRDRRVGFAIPVTGIKTTGVVRCDQPRVLDPGARNARKMDTLLVSGMEEVLFAKGSSWKRVGE
ncbi:transcriptional modulator of MazE/toxin, MazF, partial [mine drainage metagenome]